MVATGKFVLRTAADQQNPYAARLYGKGITQGRTVFYLNNAIGTRTAFLAILADGARFRGDLGNDSVVKVFYAGFELPEFETGGQHSWKFHSGAISGAPQYKAINSINYDTDNELVFTTPHGYSTGDKIAFWKRGVDAILPSGHLLDPVITTDTSYMAYVTSPTKLKVLNQYSGTPDLGNQFIFTNSGTHLDRCFIYKADALLFDTQQGRPEFFSGLNFTFSGLAYIEILLPTHLSTGTDEPTNLKVIMKGKRMYDLHIVGPNLAFNTGTITAEPNNALIAADALYHEGGVPLSRLHPTTWIDWRDRCDALIPWTGGNDAAVQPASFNLLTNATYDVPSSTITKSAGSAAWDACAATVAYTKDFASVEIRYNNEPCYIAFGSNQTAGIANKQGALIEGGYLKYLYNGQVHEIVAVGEGDTIKIVYDNDGFFIYRNSVIMPMVDNTYTQYYTTFNIVIGLYNPGATVSSILIAPAGTNSVPRNVKRFQGGYVAPSPLPVTDLFETEILLSAASWADIDGQIRIATQPDRTPCFTFVYDPAHPEIPSNVNRIDVKAKAPEDMNNFWTNMYRDDDDILLSQKFVHADRPALRAALNGRLISAGVMQFGVLNQSNIERIGEMRARIETDLNTGFTVEAFLDSLPVCKGSFVNLVAPEAGYTYESPALCIVIDERMSLSDVETRIYELQIIVPNFYSDTDHGTVTPSPNQYTSAKYIPPPYASSMTLAEVVKTLPNNTLVSAIDGDVTFGTATNQHGKVFSRVFTQQLTSILSLSSNTFTKNVGETFPGTSTPIRLRSLTGSVPTGWTDEIYYLINVTATTCQLSKTIGGSVVSLSGGSSLVFLADAPWTDAGINLIPDSTNHATFEISPVAKSVTDIRVQTFSASDTTLRFENQLTQQIVLNGGLTAPDGPASASYSYDGTRLEVQWTPSPTVGIRGYVVKDEEDRFVAQVGASTLSYVQTAQTDNVTRRIYAVSSAGVSSSTYAEVTFVRPPETTWSNVTGLTVNADNSLTKTAGTAWGNAGAILSHAVLTDRRPIRLSGAPDRTDTYQILGLTNNPSPNNLTDFEFGIYFKNDGFAEAYWNNGASQTWVGAYQVGQRFTIEVIPNLTIGEVASVRLYKDQLVNGVHTDVLIHVFTEGPLYTFYYAGVALYTNGSTSSLDPILTGDLIPITGAQPAGIINGTNASYTTGALTSTGGSGWGSGGASFPLGLQARQDGGWTFTPALSTTIGYGAIGLSLVDSDRTQADIDFNILLIDDYSYEIYNGSTLLQGGLTYTHTDTFFIGREGGVPVVRKNGDLVYVYNAASSSLKDNAVFLDTAFQHNVAAFHISNLKLWAAYTPVRTYNNKIPVTTVNLSKTAYVGKNRIIDIPEFGPNAVIDVVGSNEQLRLRYDTSNYESTTVGATGIVSRTATGSAAEEQFLSPLTLIPNVPDGNTGKVTVGGKVKTFVVDAASTTGGVDLYTFTIPAYMLMHDGDELEFVFMAETAANAHTKSLTISLNGNSIFSNDYTASATSLIVRGNLIRNGGDDDLRMFFQSTHGAAETFSSHFTDTHWNAVIDQDLVFSAVSDANNDMIAKSCTIRYFPKEIA